MAQLPTYAKSPLTIDRQIDLLVERGLKIEDREFAAHALANPNRIYSVLTLLRHMLTTIAPQSEWKRRFLALLADFPDIHRTSMALPTDFENSPLWT